MIKRTLCLLLALMMLLSLCACGGKDEPEPTPEPEETIVIPPADYEKEDGKLYREVYYNSNGLKFRTVIHEYDGYGRIAKDVELGENDAPVSYTEYKYNDDGQKTAELVYYATGPEEYEPAFKTEYEYDANGNCVKSKRTENDTVAAMTVYTYDANGVLLKEEQYEGEDFCICAYEYEYDENGKVSACLRHDFMEEKELEDRYSYNSEGLLMAVVTSDTEGNVVSRIEHDYDAEGNETKCSIFDAQGGLQSVTNNQYSYDKAGNIEKIVRSSSEGSQGTTIQYTWQYSKG